ncbi:MAG: efflux RND transporter periplasmic adaptor subunit [Akkermansiaceae bacterium]|nr:efflux RND transporter periplasmic adaptor subunit [Akkermansiaceae bacterium]
MNDITSPLGRMAERTTGLAWRWPWQAALGATVLLGAGCKKSAPPPPPPPVVEVMEVKESDIPVTSLLIGQLDSPQNVAIRARVEAYVKTIAFTEGGNVKKGDLLFELNEEPFIERLTAAEAQVAEAEAALRKAQADLARMEPLKNTGAVSKTDFDKSVAAVETGTANLEAAKARVESAKLDLGYCKVHAPIDGLIGAKEVSVGDLVGKGEPTLLATMSSLNPIWCYSNIAESDYLKVQNRIKELGIDLSKLPLTLILSNGDEHPEKGKIVFFDRAVAATTGTMRMRSEFPNPTELLRPGMFARIRIEGGTRKGLQIPERATVMIQGRTFVWALAEDQTVSQREITLGNGTPAGVIVTDGLKPGEKIVVEGTHKVRQGMKVAAAAPKAQQPPQS